jgi:tetratricopeptide (TPR) repeat protein
MSELISQVPEHFQNYIIEAEESHQVAKNHDAFEDIKSKSRERIKESDATLMENARTLMGHKEYQLAISLLRSVLSRSPYFAPAIRRIGVCHRELGRLDHALKCFQVLVKAETSSENLILLADAFYIMERDQEAMKVYQTALMDVNIPMNALFNVYKNLGNIFVRMRDFETAEEYYHKAFSINADSDILLVNYGTLEIQRENLEKALRYFREAIVKNSENDRAWVGLSLVHRHMGDFELSHANIERSLDINPKNRTALKLLVEWGVCDFKYANVIERLQEYLGLESEDTEMSFTLAKIFAHLNRLDEAQIEMQRVLALDSEIPGAQQLAKAIREAKISEVARR